jgi:hypothetical protein
MTRAMAASLATGLWRLGALLELPRDMHCSHEPPTIGAVAVSEATLCPECRRVLEVMEALRNERPS